MICMQVGTNANVHSYPSQMQGTFKTITISFSFITDIFLYIKISNIHITHNQSLRTRVVYKRFQEALNGTKEVTSFRRTSWDRKSKLGVGRDIRKYETVLEPTRGNKISNTIQKKTRNHFKKV